MIPMPPVFRVEPRHGWLTKRFVVLCDDFEAFVTGDEEMAKQLAAAMNEAHRVGFLDGRGYALKEAAAIAREPIEYNERMSKLSLDEGGGPR